MLIADKLPPVFRLDQAASAGVSKDRIYRLRDAGVIEPAGRGVYIQTGLVDPVLAPLVAATLRQPMATLCLTSALIHHGLNDQLPTRTDIALPRGTRGPAGFAHVIWHAFGVDTFSIGRETQNVSGMNVGIYSPERTLVDVFRLSHQQGTDIANEALRRWLRTHANQPSALLAIAKRFPASYAQIRHALEILL